MVHMVGLSNTHITRGDSDSDVQTFLLPSKTVSTATEMTLANESIDIPARSESPQAVVIEDATIADNESCTSPHQDREIGVPRDPEFFFDMLVLLVEGYLFSVPRMYFEQSEVFQDMLQLPLGLLLGEGTTIEHPLRLDGVKADDFRAFLTVLIRLPSSNLDGLTKDRWVAVLHLATMWEFKLIRSLAIEELSAIGMTAVERILVARREDIPDWLIASHGYLIALDTFPSTQVMEALGGIQFCVNIGKARETIRWQRQQRNPYDRSRTWNWANDIGSWYSIVVELFDLPNDAMNQLNRDLLFIDYVEPVDEDLESSPVGECAEWNPCEPAILEKPKKKRKAMKKSSQGNPLVHMEDGGSSDVSQGMLNLAAFE